MTTAIAAFLNAHFNALLGGVTAESTAIAMIYGAIANDMAFAIIASLTVAILALAGAKVFKNLDCAIAEA